MQQQLQHRLHELKSEFELGQKALAESEAKSKDLRDTLLRISGAIQVLEEELGKQNSGHAAAPEDFTRVHSSPNDGAGS